MKCPKCNSEKTDVKDSRPSTDGAIRRRRECVICATRFTTFERFEPSEQAPRDPNIVLVASKLHVRYVDVERVLGNCNLRLQVDQVKLSDS